MSHPSKTEVAAAVPARVEHLESRRLFAAPFSDADLAGDVVLITESERATIQPRGNLQIPAGTLTTTDGVDHAVNGNYIVRTDGIIGVSLSALDLDQQGFDGWLNSSKDVAIGINGALGPDPTPPEQQDLALILKHSLIFSPADLLGTWRIHGTHASGSLAFDGTGKVIGGEITSGSAQPAAITGGTYIISQQGDVSVTVTTGSGTTALALRGTLNNSKDVLGRRAIRPRATWISR